LQKKKLYDSSRLDVVEIARVAWHASELVFILVGLRTYQHPGVLYLYVVACCLHITAYTVTPVTYRHTLEVKVAPW